MRMALTFSGRRLSDDKYFLHDLISSILNSGISENKGRFLIFTINCISFLLRSTRPEARKDVFS